MRVLLVDDHTLFRQGLRTLLEKHGAFQVVGEAEDGRRGVTLVEELHPSEIVLRSHDSRSDHPASAVLRYSAVSGAGLSGKSTPSQCATRGMDVPCNSTDVSTMKNTK